MVLVWGVEEGDEKAHGLRAFRVFISHGASENHGPISVVVPTEIPVSPNGRHPKAKVCA